jgi:glycosyltransferase involved in cell wall biosynthesis
VRVVFLTPDLPRWSADPSGASLVLLARALVRRRIEVRIIAARGEKSGTTELDGVPVQVVRASSQGSLAWGPLLRSWRSLASALRADPRPGKTVVHAFGWAPAGLALGSGLPAVITVQSADAALLRHSRVARMLARRLFRRKALITAVSREVGSWVESGVGLNIDATHIQPLPIDTRGYPWTRGGGGAVLIAPLLPSARVDLAIQTVAVLASCGHDLSLTVVGEGPERRSLEQRAASLGVAALVRFQGDRPLEEVRRYLERSDLMLFTPKADPTALAAVEGVLSGIPVVACWDGGAAVDVVPESGAGRLSLPAAESLADAILSLQADPDRLAMARLVGESWRARLAPDHVADVCAGWYRDALSR